MPRLSSSDVGAPPTPLAAPKASVSAAAEGIASKLERPPPGAGCIEPRPPSSIPPPSERGAGAPASPNPNGAPLGPKPPAAGTGPKPAKGLSGSNDEPPAALPPVTRGDAAESRGDSSSSPLPRFFLFGTCTWQTSPSRRQRPHGSMASRSHLTFARLQLAHARLTLFASLSHGMPRRRQRGHGRWSMHAVLARWQFLHACSLGPSSPAGSDGPPKGICC